jgi:hypothetical protein
MVRCLNPGCPWRCGTRGNPSCAENMMRRGLASFLWIVLIGSLAAAVLFN